jgi:serine/threonine-protein kinase
MQGVYAWLKPEEVMPKAREAAERALASEVTLADVYASRASVKAVYEWDFEGAGRDFERAIELDPGYAIAYQWYAMNTLLPMARFDEAWRRLGEAHERDPLSLPILASKGIYWYYRRDYDQAIAELERALEVDAGFVPAHVFLSHSYAGLRRWDDAGRELEEAEQLAGERPDILAGLGHVLAAKGANAEVKRILDRLYKIGKNRYVSPSLRAQVYAGLGRPRSAVDALKAAVKVRAADLVWIGLNPVFEPLAGDGEFEAILAMIGVEAHARS